MAATKGRTRAMAAVQDIFDRYFILAKQKNYNGFDTRLMREAKLVDARDDGSTVTELTITEPYTNMNGVMHGGAAGVIFDMFTTIALGPLAKPGYWDFLGGVTRSLNISYLKAIPVGTTIHVNSHVVQIGRTMALIKGEMTSVDGKKIYATVDHHKVNVPTPKEHMAVKTPLDEQLEREGEREDGGSVTKSNL